MMENPIAQIAEHIVSLCREEKYDEVYETYFTEETRAVEPVPMGERDPVTVGKTAIIEKGEIWASMVDTVELKISDPSMVNGNQFIVQMDITTKNKETGKIETGSEYVLYTVENNKVLEEKFFYITHS